MDGMYKQQLYIKVLLLSVLVVGFYFVQKSTALITLGNSDSSTSIREASESTSDQIQTEMDSQTSLLSAILIPQIEILDSPRVDLNIPELQGTSGDGENRKMTLRATAYNSLTAQTDSTPFITSTGAKTRFGIVAVSRDMLDERLPYGSLVKIKDLGHYKTGRTAGTYNDLLSEETFIVEDTMHPRKRQQMDVWFPTYNQATQWGVRKIEVEVVRYGRTGPRLDDIRVKNKSDFNFNPQQTSR